MQKIVVVAATAVLLSACGGSSGGGSNNGGGSSTPNQPPTAVAPNDIDVNELETVTLNGGASSDSDGQIASYRWSQTGGPAITLQTPQAAQASFIAPAITTGDETVDLTFSLTVTDNDGATATDSVTVSVANIVIAPSAVITASGDAVENQEISLDARASFDPDGNVASFQWQQTAGTPVTLTAADTSLARFTAPDIADPNQSLDLSFSVTVTDNEGNTDIATTNIRVVDETLAAAQISGTLTFDHVPHNSSNSSLDYNQIEQLPIRGATVELVNASGTVIDSTVSDNLGQYQFETERNQSVRIRVIAEMVATGSPSWDFKVVDNTNSQAIYSLTGELASSGSGEQTRDLNAASGWTGNGYTETRAAGPFAILDNVYDAYTKVVAVDSDVAFAPLLINWSVNNRPEQGDREQGQITTSFYSQGEIYILGAANVDTDEYDGHVIIHEWGHYFEDVLARSDSIGGSHSAGQRLDPRLAFGEGFGNAFSGIVTDDPFYRDSLGVSQSQGFSINVEGNNYVNSGWYNSGSIQSILYDLYDENNDGSDTVSLGFGPLYDVLVGAQRNTDALTSIFSLVTYMKEENPASANAINNLVSAQTIVANNIDIYGSTETNNAGNSQFVLPVYTQLTVNGSTQQVCSTDSFGVQDGFKFNKLGTRRFMRVNITNAGNHTITADSTTNVGDPDVLVFRRGELLNSCGPTTGCSGDLGSETLAINLSAGEHVLEIIEFNNVSLNATGLNNCIDVTIQRN